MAGLCEVEVEVNIHNMNIQRATSLPPDPERWHRSPIGWLRVDGLHVHIGLTSSTVWTPKGELMAWACDFQGPGREDALVLCDLVDELVPLDPRALVGVKDLVPDA